LKLLAALLLAASIHVSPANMAKVLKVHHCEETSWNVNGSEYQGGLGWLHATWLEFRLPSFPMSAAQATIQQQAFAMVRFAAKYGWPDQEGNCYGY
jgi:hypothetical protein